MIWHGNKAFNKHSYCPGALPGGCRYTASEEQRGVIPSGGGIFGTTQVLSVAFPQSWAVSELRAASVTGTAAVWSLLPRWELHQRRELVKLGGPRKEAHSSFSLGKAILVSSLSNLRADLGTGYSGGVM